MIGFRITLGGEVGDGREAWLSGENVKTGLALVWVWVRVNTVIELSLRLEVILEWRVCC